ncbi:Hsp70 family protein [Dactylosporangium sp. NBC_01737]|uniref:Hsp70 family protein n=1 Tax=Dactylosporangium sp. NBC_01737 TaxID=2975959 RepID=UPI002E124D08|nr:Hsp70 family protein [Dactylosporangium sp. NBC_01737]
MEVDTVQTVRLGIDFGTSHTVAVLGRPGGRADALLFEASPLMPSAVYLADDETMLVGRDAEHSARIEPAAYEPHPKRRIDEGSVLLGGREVPVERLIESVLRRVGEEAGRILGGPPGGTVLTHPAGWGATRRGLLTTAARNAGLADPTLVAEPVAAAMYFTGVLGHRVPDGHAVVVYDFGGGTFDISVVRRLGDGWHVAAASGLDDVGGIDLDAAVVDWTRARVAARAPELWERLERPATVTDRRHRRMLWDDARSTKELLSRATSAGLTIPLYDVDVYLTRPEFETLARPWVDRTVALTTATLFASDVTAGRLAGVFLVGGASRVPLVATLLHQALGIAPVVLEQPELVVAHGSLITDPGPLPTATLPTVLTTPPPPPPAAPELPVPPAAAPAPAPVAAPTPTPPFAPAPAPPTEPEPEPEPIRAGGRWPFIAFAVIAALGVLSLLAGDFDDDYGPPFVSGLLTPLLPKSVLVLLAMVIGVAVGGAPGRIAAPAHRALGPAMLATGGGAVALLMLGLTRHSGDAFSITDGDASRGEQFSAAALWVVAVAAVAVLIVGVYLAARPPSVDPLVAPRRRPGRPGWFAVWVAAGALLVLATGSRRPWAYPAFNGGEARDVQPLRGLMLNGGAIGWWGGYLLGLALMLGAALLLGAALRAAIVRSPAVHRGMRPIGWFVVAECGGLLLLNVVWDRQVPPYRGAAADVQSWYWSTFVRLDGLSGTHPAVWLALALTATVAVAVPSLVRSARAARRPALEPKGD